MATTGERLRLERQAADLKQKDVARVARQTCPTITPFVLLYIEKGEREPTPEESAAIRKAIQDLTRIETQKRALMSGKS